MRYARKYGTWQLSDLFGCNQVCVSHGAFVLPEKQKQGYGRLYHKERLQQMKDLHYDYSICTTNATNITQNRILADNGWKILDSFISSKTRHNVVIWGRDI